MQSSETSSSTQDPTTPAGYLRNAQGHLVPEQLVQPIDLARDQVVRDLVRRAKNYQEALTVFKRTVFAELSAFVELSAEQYQVKIGGAKGNLTLHSFDGKYKVVRQLQETITFDERLQVAKQLIDECIQRWQSGPEIRVLVNDAFQVDKAGKINTGRVLGLRRHSIDDPQWHRAMTAISDSVRSDRSTTYVRFYERIGDSDQYRPISLDLASL